MHYIISVVAGDSAVVQVCSCCVNGSTFDSLRNPDFFGFLGDCGCVLYSVCVVNCFWCVGGVLYRIVSVHLASLGLHSVVAVCFHIVEVVWGLVSFS